MVGITLSSRRRESVRSCTVTILVVENMWIPDGTPGYGAHVELRAILPGKSHECRVLAACVVERAGPWGHAACSFEEEHLSQKVMSRILPVL